MFRRTEREPGDFIEDEDDDGLRIYSDDDDEEIVGPLFEAGQRCDICHREDGVVGIDPTCRGAYEGDPVMVGEDCLDSELSRIYDGVDGVAVVVEPFGQYSAHYYYRIDEMPAYQFVREDVEGVSWLTLTVGDECARCGGQSHFAWIPPDLVYRDLPENESVFRNLQADLEHLCGKCAGQALAAAYLGLRVPLVVAEVPRSAMGIMMPTGE